jgi:hypothetical protein
MQAAGKAVLLTVGGLENEHGAIARHAAQLILRQRKLRRIVHDIGQFQILPVMPK